MNASAVLARNLLIHAQLREIAAGFARLNTPAILLKGIALIELFPGYSAERMMEDMDLLVRKRDIGAVRGLLGSLGYAPAPEDPWAFRRPGSAACVDLSDGLWYLDDGELEDLWAASERWPVRLDDDGVEGVLRHLPPDELYIHALAHAAVHHAAREGKWARDLELILEKWGDATDRELLEGKIEAYGFGEPFRRYLGTEGGRPGIYSLLVNHNIPLRGHLLRFLCLPARKKARYLASALFPDDTFITHRYGITKARYVPLYRAARPLLLFGKLLTLPLRRVFCRS